MFSSLLRKSVQVASQVKFGRYLGKHFSKTSPIDAPLKLTAAYNVYRKQRLIIILVPH